MYNKTNITFIFNYRIKYKLYNKVIYAELKKLFGKGGFQ